MRIVSALGTFELNFTGIRIEGRNLVLVGRMGVWEGAKMVITPQEMAFLARKSLNLSLIRYLLKLPYTILRKNRLKQKEAKV
ncbi:MAG: hypothetical protein HYY20_14060 [Candidatus Tectomicrobia bacterium]|uniref:Uncharacterized protein n=1 Tax=Tectimicrobiota bacterium TaxID=2528274 RepID=A0A932CRE3_UNCTE|nr:hypothetical protein [Candidatus Tectomicrobia bacterium]